ncbi:MAG: acyl-CoA dehydrogenase family protein [Promethearchaeota archaeon]|jgi:alkylation response protein AidB-like acyl-CoA dehydrogenase
MKGKVQCIDSEILEKLSLEHRYNFLNHNLFEILKPSSIEFLKEAQEFYLKFESKNKITHNEDFYDWFPEIGKAGLITRVNRFSEVGIDYEPYGMTADFMRYLATDFFDPQLGFGILSTVLAINPLVFHHENIELRLKILKELVTGEKIGCICITEPKRGSDAVHMLTTCKEDANGSFIINGEKIYQTNGPKSDVAIVYACVEEDNGNTMGQFLVDTSWDGWNVERVNIPWTPRLFIGKESFSDLKVPADYVLGKPGRGRDHLFEGLNLERLSIVFINLSEAWNALAHAIIYANMRKQFNKEIIKHQGVGFPLADMWAKTMNLTLATLHICHLIDEKREKFGDIPQKFNLSLVNMASQLKSQSAKLTERVCFKCADLMGGAGLCDNTLMSDLLGISRTWKVGGGTSQIQNHILSSSLRQSFKHI